jgi:hypothetical protein
LILDWKTDAKALGRLRSEYLAQIAAYAHALRELTGCEVEAGIFSTVRGHFAAYEAGEVEDAWRSLGKLGPAELNKALQRDVEGEFDCDEDRSAE